MLSLECVIQILKNFNAFFTQNSELLNLNTRQGKFSYPDEPIIQRSVIQIPPKHLIYNNFR